MSCFPVIGRVSVKTGIIALIALLLTSTLCGQFFEDAEEEWEAPYQVRGEQKSAAKAIILSTLFPGSGHFYANPKSPGTFIFPLIEIGLWLGYFHYQNKGSNIEDDYMAYADEHYFRPYYSEVSDLLINHSQSANLYNRDHFRLDDDNTQHFYEDIGKYNKYIFGWEDWYLRYVNQQTGEVFWHFNDQGIWLGNRPVEGGVFEAPYSELRAHYISMRHDAQDNYNLSYMLSLGMALNRIGSSIDAARVTQKYNRELRYTQNFNLQIIPMKADSGITPTLNLVFRY